jgi:anti-sigma factor ChrR (cupin superfamily)
VDLSGLQLSLDDSALPWRPTAVPGVSWLPLQLEGDRDGGDAVVLIRMEPGRGYPPHRHRGVEDVLVLAGGYRDARGQHRAPCHLRYEEGSVHAPVALGDAERPAGPDNPACVLFAVARDGVELLGD